MSNIQVLSSVSSADAWSIVYSCIHHLPFGAFSTRPLGVAVSTPSTCCVVPMSLRRSQTLRAFLSILLPSRANWDRCHQSELSGLLSNAACFDLCRGAMFGSAPASDPAGSLGLPRSFYGFVTFLLNCSVTCFVSYCCLIQQTINFTIFSLYKYQRECSHIIPVYFCNPEFAGFLIFRGFSHPL